MNRSLDVNSCLNDFNILTTIDKYISVNDYNSFLNKYNYIISNNDKLKNIKENGLKLIKKHNEEFVSKKLISLASYFDNILKDVDPNIILDENQRKAVLIDEDYSLVVAGAGAGKTTTMAAKAKYLVEKCYINPDEIIILAFTNKACEELDYRINEQLCLNIEVLTFHKLGMKFLREIINRPVQIISTKTMYNLITEYIKELIFPNKILFETFNEVFKDYLSFDDRALYYESYDDYYKDYMDRKYFSLSEIELEEEIKKRINNRIKYYRTIKGEYVKSEGEAKIANYLYKNGIPYTYEMPYNYLLNGRRSYSPDFTIHALSGDIYVEYYGLAKLYKNGNIQSNIPEYKETIYKKREVHTEFKTDVIELFGLYEDSYYLKELSNALRERNIVKNKKSNEEIFYMLMETSKDSLFIRFNNLIINFISKFKEMNYQSKDFDELISKTNDKILKTQLKFTKEIYYYYQNSIHNNNKIDFADMINYSYQNMDKIKDLYKYKYIIIDEYQDISMQRYNFTKKLSDLMKAKIVGVGDDWQAIYSFSGSDVNLFSSFLDVMGYGEIIKINNTYRNSQELIDIAGEFISKNKNLIHKNLLSNKRIEKPIELVYYKPFKLAFKLHDIIEQLYNENSKKSILLLGRYKSDIDEVIDSNLFRRSVGNRIICNKYPNLKIEFLTIHSSKGLGYDNVILLNALDKKRGFPSQIVTPPLVAILNTSTQNEYEEERRLFYVAITRTKNKVYIMCPNRFRDISSFVKEIMNNNHVLKKH